MNARQMVKLFIERQGMDGLCNGECGCGLIVYSKREHNAP